MLMGDCTWSPHTHCPLQSPVLWEFLLNPNAMRLKEMKGDWISTTVSCLPGVTVVNWGLVCVMFANTQVCS